jgi:hypothetical protein
MKPKASPVRRAASWLGLAWLVVLLVSGCDLEPKATESARQAARKPETAPVKDKEEELTPEIAKKTLLELAMTQIPPGVMAHAPKDVPIKFLGADEIEVGDWRCNLKDKTFFAGFYYPDAPRHQVNEVRGVFQRAPGGKWVAKVTDTRS